MAKNDLVTLDMGYYGKYVLPVKAASTILTTLVESGATRIESDYIQGVGTIYRPAKNEAAIRYLDGMFDPDIPMDSEARQPYLDWLKTKAELTGPGYQAETYAAYLAAKEMS